MQGEAGGQCVRGGLRIISGASILGGNEEGGKAGAGRPGGRWRLHFEAARPSSMVNPRSTGADEDSSVPLACGCGEIADMRAHVLLKKVRRRRRRQTFGLIALVGSGGLRNLSGVRGRCTQYYLSNIYFWYKRVPAVRRALPCQCNCPGPGR